MSLMSEPSARFVKWIRSGGGEPARRCRLASVVAAVVGAPLLSVVATVPAQAEDPALAMSSQTRAMLEATLDETRMASLEQTLSAPDAWGSLGPHPTGEPAPLPVPAPERELELTIPDDAAGSGTADDPYLDVIGDFLDARFDYEPTSIEAYRSYPEEGEIDQYMATVPHERTVVRVPAGHYRETIRAMESPHRHYDEQLVGVDVPPGVWLQAEAEGEVVVEPAIEEGVRGTLINLNIRAGLQGFTLDGGSVPGFEPEPETRVSAVETAHEAVIVDNHIRDFTNRGITPAGSRGRAGSDVFVANNVIEQIGYGGIVSHSRWLVRDNQIRYAGLLRPTGGGGDDGIKPGWAVEGRIVNNLFVLARRPHGRHAISGQTSHDHLVAGNISIVEGELRNNIGFSDGSHRNRFIGNVVLGTGQRYEGGRSLVGISVNGYGTEIRHNFVLGHPRGVRTRGREDEPVCIIADNYVEYIVADIHRSSYYEAENNVFRQTGERHGARAFSSPLPGIDAFELEEQFDLFKRAAREEAISQR